MSEARFSLVAGEGDGAILGLAAGDTAGGAWELGYSAVTEVATVISYQLIERGALDLDQLVADLLELDGSMDEEPVLRAESPELRSWLDRARTGSSSPDDTPSLDAMARSAPLGLAYRDDPATLVSQTIALCRMFDSDASSILAGVTVASGVAASCFGQAGRDFIVGVAEAVRPATAELVSGSHGVVGVDQIEGYEARLTALLDSYGARTADEVSAAVPDDAGPLPLVMALRSILLVAPTADRPHEPVAECARLGGSALAAAGGAIIGARVGIRAWPWAFANDTWFAEIGRRLVRGPQEIRDLPIPYAVEQHLISGVRQDHP